MIFTRACTVLVLLSILLSLCKSAAADYFPPAPPSNLVSKKTCVSVSLTSPSNAFYVNIVEYDAQQIVRNIVVNFSEPIAYLGFTIDILEDRPYFVNAPQTGDRRIDIIGHTNITAYNGNGVGWTQVSVPASFQWSNSISTSMHSGTPHWVCEVIIDKISFGIGADYWLRIVAYDASNAAAGVQAWPPTSRDVPSNWGDITYTTDAIPESLSFGAVVVLSSAALIVASYYLRKRPKTTILTPTKL